MLTRSDSCHRRVCGPDSPPNSGSDSRPDRDLESGPDKASHSAAKTTAESTAKTAAETDDSVSAGAIAGSVIAASFALVLIAFVLRR